MTVWDEMREWALPAFEIADCYAPDKNAGENRKVTKDKKRHAWMLVGAVLCFVSAGLYFNGYKKRK